MYNVPTTEAESSEIEAPKYIDLQTERRRDGLSSFQAMAPSSSTCGSFSSVSSFSKEHASVSLISIVLDVRKSLLVASLSRYSW